MAYRLHQRPAPKRNRQETIISTSAPDRPTNGAASSLAFADLPEGLAQKAQGFVKPGRLLIDGAWVEALSGKTFETFNPATEERLGQVAHGAAEDIELAVAAARRAFDDERSDWRRMTPSERGKVIHRIGDLIENNADELATLDNGKPLAIAKAADVALSADPVPLHVGLGDEDRGPHHPDLRCHVARVGVPRLGAEGITTSMSGREMGHNALENYLETKSVVTQLASRGDRLQWPRRRPAPPRHHLPRKKSSP